MRRRKYYKTNRRHKKRGRGFPYIYNNRVYFEKKNTKRNQGSFTSYKTSFKRCWRRYWTFMVENVWFINRKKSKRKNKRKYKAKRAKGFGDGFKLLYSLGKQWRNSVR